MTTLLNNPPDSGPPPRQIRFVHNQGQPPSKRRRINAACLTCRRRKTRCAGERPLCSTCTKNGHQCLGYPEDRKDGEGAPRTGDEDGASTEDANQGDDDAVARKRAASGPANRPTSSGGGNLQATPAVAGASASRPPRRNIKQTIELGADANPSDAEPQQSPVMHQHHHKHHYHHHHQAHLSVTSDDLPSSPTLRRSAPSRRIPYFRYFGSTAIVPGFKQMVVSVRDRRRSTGGSHSGASLHSTPSGALASGSAIDSDIVREDIPSYDPNNSAPVHPLIIQLVNTFFIHVGCNYPFLQKDKFLRHVKEKRVEPILVDAVCAIAARFSDHHILTGGNDKMPRTERGQVFAQRARQATVDTFPCPSVGAVQACLLMAYEGFGENQDSALWMYLGLAIRMAVDLGLQKCVGIQYQGEKDPWYTRHRSRVNDDDHDSPEAHKVDGVDALSPEEQKEVEQERMYTFWSVFILDRVISSGTGRPVTIRDGDYELAIPESSNDLATGWPNPFPVFIQIINLYGQVCDVLNNLRDAQDLTQDKWDQLSEMEHRLTKMYKHWDPRLQFNVNNFKTYLGMGQGTNFILLHFWFHALFIILHQPTLLTPFCELRSELQLLSDSRELSMSSAKTICDILSFADLIDPTSFIGNPFTNQPIYIAACAFLMESSANNASEGSSREGSPPTQGSRSKQQTKHMNKQSRHSLLASAANQNYQRCYNSLQQIQAYWGGVGYILTALDQKSKGKWDCETYTVEEYESTKLPPPRPSIGEQLSRFEKQSSPKIAGSPIAWSLSGTANSPNSSLTLMYQALNASSGGHTGFPPPAPHTMARAANGSSPGSITLDPIRHTMPEVGMFTPTVPQPNMSAIRNSPRRPYAASSMNAAGANNSRNQHVMGFEDIPEESPETKGLMSTYTTSGQGYDAYTTSVSPTSGNSGGMVSSSTAVTSAPGGNSTNSNANSSSSSSNNNNNMYFAQSMAYQAAWGPMTGSNMDAITFDSQDIDIEALGLQQPDLMGGWLEYLPSDVLGLFDEHGESGQGSGH
ncbi:N-terminal binuclear Zn cluster-containing/DNA binding domain-containing protein [Trichoderma citrinoviride]|uniref:N-terminal binuclear Zn cluster-containing/DNA binding domain-containing protein n=1 Tax=Trichoderma citrinoviride TaxID=58853 RepID=A0A2T4B2Y3_9HYPO|nr:N-terminal binuclear Zn cluster-containing/DNA binding domain-containing protein [Trichoderma citrinoviride]PTB63687.1 N-terminal binuclear Zn cluster-containing/DNA binding domain-containing protein [Trichoderma citrinoviride]